MTSLSVPVLTAIIAFTGAIVSVYVTYQIFQNNARIDWIQKTREKVAELLESFSKLFAIAKEIAMVERHVAEADEALRTRAIECIGEVVSKMTELGLYFGPDDGPKLNKENDLSNQHTNAKKNNLIVDKMKETNEALIGMENVLYDGFDKNLTYDPSVQKYADEVRNMQDEFMEMFRIYFKVEWKRSHKNHAIPIGVMVVIVVLLLAA